MSSREEFEYEAGKALSLPVSIIEQARKGDRYDHDFDSMSLMQPLNGWWHWWQAGREGLESRLKSAESNDIDARCHVAELEAKCAALAAENAALKAFGGKLGDMHNDLNGEGTGIQGRAEVAIQQVALEAAIEEFDAINTPATDAFLAEVRAGELDSLAGVAETMLVKFSNQQCSSDMHEVVGWKMVHQQASNRAAQLLQEPAQ